jgi:hypothetical protein
MSVGVDGLLATPDLTLELASADRVVKSDADVPGWRAAMDLNFSSAERARFLTFSLVREFTRLRTSDMSTPRFSESLDRTWSCSSLARARCRSRGMRVFDATAALTSTLA